MDRLPHIVIAVLNVIEALVLRLVEAFGREVGGDETELAAQVPEVFAEEDLERMISGLKRLALNGRGEGRKEGVLTIQ